MGSTGMFSRRRDVDAMLFRLHEGQIRWHRGIEQGERRDEALKGQLFELIVQKL